MPPPPKDTPTQQQGAMQKRLQQLPVFARELLAGGAAGGLAKTCVAPLERTKIIFQTRGGGKMTVSGVLQHIWHNEGVPGLFRGNTASVLRIVPYAAIHFGSYEYIRRFTVQLAGAEGGHGPDAPSALPVYDLMAGSASGAIAVIATYPLDLVRTRLAWATEAPAQQQLAAVAAAGGVSPRAVHQQPGIWATLGGTMAEEGLAGLYRGCAPTLLGILPYAGLKFYVYQTMKNKYRSWQIHEDRRQQQEKQQQQQPLAQQQQQPPREQEQQEGLHLPPAPPFETALQQADLAEEEQLQRPQKLPVSVTLLFGGAAGLVAQTVTYPLDVIRRQMQVSHLQIAAQARIQPQAASSSGGGGSGSSMTHAGSQRTGAVQASSSSSSKSSSSSSKSSGRQFGSKTGCTASPAGVPNHLVYAASRAQPAQQPLHAASTHSQSSRSSSTSTSSRQLVSLSNSSSNSSSIRQQLRHLSSSAGKPAAAAAADPSMADVALRLWRSGGMFRGLSINYLKVVPSTAIGFTVYDYLKAYLGLTHT